jgi:hypothetical protein
VTLTYPVADPLARYRYALAREHERPSPSGFDAERLIASHRSYSADEAAMAAASITRVVGAGDARASARLGRPARAGRQRPGGDHRRAGARLRRGGRKDRARPLPRGPRHTFTQQPSPETDKCIALMRDFIGSQLP